MNEIFSEVKGFFIMANELVKPMFALSFQEFQGSVIALKHEFQGDTASPGVNVSLDSIISMLSTISNNSTSIGAGFIPNNVFYKTNDMIGWSVKSKKRKLLFSNTIKSEINVVLPDMVCFASPSGIHAFAVKSLENISLETELYHTPMMNFYFGGGMCRGSVKLPDLPTIDNLSEYEDAIFNTYNTHVNHTETLNLKGVESVETGDYFKAMKSLEGLDSFNYEWLKETGMTLFDFINKGWF